MSADRMPTSRGIAPLADIPDREGGDGGPELVIRGEHPVIAMPVLPRPGHEVSEPVEELKWGKLDDDAGVRPRGLPPSIGRFLEHRAVFFKPPPRLWVFGDSLFRFSIKATELPKAGYREIVGVGVLLLA